MYAVFVDLRVYNISYCEVASGLATFITSKHTGGTNHLSSHICGGIKKSVECTPLGMVPLCTHMQCSGVEC